MSNVSASPVIGILGGGQLGRMLALAGYPLGLRFRIFDPTPDAPAGHLAEHVTGDYHDTDALAHFATGLTAVTYEFENVPVTTAEYLAKRVPVFPPPAALATAQDRLAEKQFFRQLAIPTPAFAPVNTRAELDAALAALGYPAVLKTRRLGYDGKGQAVLRAPADADSAWAALGAQALILEAWAPFTRELSVLAVRGRDGTRAIYPLVENVHHAGILRVSRAPAANVSPAQAAQAAAYATRALDALNYVGVLAIELFEVDGTLLANEMAPRVHNSGHWTIEGAHTSQFANHLRAGLRLPLGDPGVRGYAAMVNLIGDVPDPARVLAVPGAALHLYGKAPRPGRKLGHVTVTAARRVTLEARVQRVQTLVNELDAG